MKNDILELIEKYGYHLHKQYDEICDYLKEREMMMNEKEDFETNSEIIDNLDNIEREIFELLKDGIQPKLDEKYYLGKSDLYVGNPELYIVQQSSLEEECHFIQQSPLEEKELEKNLEIEETIKNELKNQHHLEEKEAMYYLENEIKELNMNTKHHEMNTNLLDYKQKIKNLKNQVYCFKDNLYRFNENIRIFKNNVDNLVTMIDMCDRLCKIKR
jgi:hypothetical protein